MNCPPLGSSAHGIFQARVLEWGAITFSGLMLALVLNSCTVSMKERENGAFKYFLP